MSVTGEGAPNRNRWPAEETVAHAKNGTATRSAIQGDPSARPGWCGTSLQVRHYTTGTPEEWYRRAGGTM